MTFRSFRRSLFGWGLFLLGCLSLSPNAFAAGAAEPVTVTLTAEEERLLRELLVRIEDKDLAKRVGAANAIGGLANGRTVPPRGSVGKASPRTIAALAKGLQDPEASMRMASAYALSHFLKHAKHAAPPLIRSLLRDKDARVRCAAADALGQIGQHNHDLQQAVDALTRALGDRTAVCISALRALAGFHAGAGSAVPRILTCASDPDPRIRDEAVRALGWIDPRAKECIDVFKKTLADDATRRSAARGLGKSGAARECTPLLLEALRAELRVRNGGECMDIAYALGEAGLASSEIVPALIGLLGHRSGSTRLSAANALGKIGADAKDAIPALEKLAKDEIPGVAKEAEEALSKIKG